MDQEKIEIIADILANCEGFPVEEDLITSIWEAIKLNDIELPEHLVYKLAEHYLALDVLNRLSPSFKTAVWVRMWLYREGIIQA